MTLSILLMSVIPLHAQSINGTVVEKGNGSPVAGAMVMLKNAGGAVVRYSYADGDGKFTIVYAAQAGDSCYIEVRMMGFRTEVMSSVSGRHDGADGGGGIPAGRGGGAG